MTYSPGVGSQVGKRKANLVLHGLKREPGRFTVGFRSEVEDGIGSIDGYLAASANGGSQPYSFNWSNTATTAINLFLSPGTYTVTVTDANGCTDEQIGEIIATDITPPILYVQNITGSLDVDGIAHFTAEDLIQVGFDTECEIASTSVEPNSFDCTELGIHTVVVTATDVNGNASTATATVKVIDNVFPVLSCLTQ